MLFTQERLGRRGLLAEREEPEPPVWRVEDGELVRMQDREDLGLSEPSAKKGKPKGGFAGSSRSFAGGSYRYFSPSAYEDLPRGEAGRPRSMPHAGLLRGKGSGKEADASPASKGEGKFKGKGGAGYPPRNFSKGKPYKGKGREEGEPARASSSTPTYDLGYYYA